MWNGKRIAVVLPTYRERDSIAAVIKGFESLGIVDDILVVNNNAQPGTSDEVATTSAREVIETVQGYGAAIQRGVCEVDADLVCVCEPDSTFEPSDLFKLLPFTAECDAVFGSRTVQTFIWSNANMGWFLRQGNWAVAKLIEVIFNTAYLSDVGCTYRVLSRECIQRIAPGFRSNGSRFGLEMQLLVVLNREHFVQVPVNYRPRVGVSAVTGDRGKAVTLGLDMIGLVLRTRLRSRRIRSKLGRRPVA
jgi:glycosyltransferase involved in cell wall biosynthesis